MTKLYISLVLACGLLGCSSSSSFEAYAKAYDSGICHIHHTQMKREVLPVLYGYSLYTKEDHPALRIKYRNFPFARRAISGGCDASISVDNYLPENAPAIQLDGPRMSSLANHPTGQWTHRSGLRAHRPGAREPMARGVRGADHRTARRYSCRA